MGSGESVPEPPAPAPADPGTYVINVARGADQFLMSNAMYNELLESEKQEKRLKEKIKPPEPTTITEGITTHKPQQLMPLATTGTTGTSKKSTRAEKKPLVEPVHYVRTNSTKQQLNIFECPLCSEMFKLQIIQCNNGHSFCSNCIGYTRKMCPVCRGDISGRVRNLSLEALLLKLNPNQPEQTRINQTVDIGNKDFLCQTGSKYNQECSWRGPNRDVMTHFSVAHSDRIISANDTVAMDVNFDRPSRDVLLVRVPNRSEPVYLIRVVDVQKRYVFWTCRVAASHYIVNGYSYSISFWNKSSKRHLEFSMKCKSMKGKESDIYLSRDCICLPFNIVETLLNARGLIFTVLVSYSPQPKPIISKAYINTNV